MWLLLLLHAIPVIVTSKLSYLRYCIWHTTNSLYPIAERTKKLFKNEKSAYLGFLSCLSVCMSLSVCLSVCPLQRGCMILFSIKLMRM